MTEQVGQHSSSLTTARYDLAGAGITNSSFSFWWIHWWSSVTAATEEYNVYGEPNTFQNIGQVWYNGTTKALKFTDETFSSAWATGGNLWVQQDIFKRSGNSNSKFSFWWIYNTTCNLLDQLQKNMMVQLGQLVEV
jgi:hypothetical protein